MLCMHLAGGEKVGRSRDDATCINSLRIPKREWEVVEETAHELREECDSVFTRGA